MFRHENDATRQRQHMEQEMHNRQILNPVQQINTGRYDGGRASAPSPSWRNQPVPHQIGGGGPTTTVNTYVQQGGQPGPVVPQWQQAAGASTKARTHGDFKDPDGHKVRNHNIYSE